MTRTLDPAATEWPYFSAAIVAALGAMFDEMAARGVRIAVVPGLSTGLYAGNHRARINGPGQFARLIDTALDTPPPQRPAPTKPKSTAGSSSGSGKGGGSSDRGSTTGGSAGLARGKDAVGGHHVAAPSAAGKAGATAPAREQQLVNQILARGGSSGAAPAQSSSSRGSSALASAGSRPSGLGSIDPDSEKGKALMATKAMHESKANEENAKATEAALRQGRFC